MKNWNDLTDEEKRQKVLELDEICDFRFMADNAETAAYDARIAVEGCPEWFNFEVESLDDFEKEITEIIRNEYFK